MLDYALPTVGFTILYMPIICGAAWSLGSREGYFVAMIVAFLTVMPDVDSEALLVPEILALRVTVRVVTFLSLAGAINSFRRSYDREQFHAHRDGMTGMLNKTVFQLRCAMTIQDAAHTGQILLLAILDLDDFKDVNNRQGHQAGDEVLATFAEGMSAIMRREDLIGRIGGDEFSLLARVPSIPEGRSFAHDIHARLSAVLAASRYPVTCSVGALLIPAHAPRDLGRLMHEADQAMYRAKRAGKGAILVVTEPGMQMCR
jgi:diguanylate cyclase (GGDEF)-like protein